tara:strand:- start:41 stop:364 length:324 start_codon:yes stop_codon:yes gene_type:complete
MGVFWMVSSFVEVNEERCDGGPSPIFELNGWGLSSVLPSQPGIFLPFAGGLFFLGSGEVPVLGCAGEDAAVALASNSSPLREHANLMKMLGGVPVVVFGDAPSDPSA